MSKSYEDYEKEGLFKRFEKDIEVEKAKDSEDIIRYYREWSTHGTTAKQELLLKEYARRHDITVIRAKGISERKGIKRKELKKRYVARRYYTKKGMVRKVVVLQKRDSKGRFVKSEKRY